jgi:23S rRNA (pseudouridine1915-N3)-methyltransferase
VKISILAVGKLKDGPERSLVSRYVERCRETGKALGLLGFEMLELAESRASRPSDRKAEEGRMIAVKTSGATMVALDERGHSPKSEEFARWIARWRDDGVKQLMFVIGGADGLDPALVDGADAKLAFGAMTLPHQLARIVLAEQLYRATTLLSGHPYHRV